MSIAQQTSSKNKMAFSILTLGITSVILQFVLARELQITFLGNELSLGLILFSWLAGTSIGSLIGRRFLKHKNLKNIFCLLFLLNYLWCFIGIYLSRSLKGLIGISLYEIIQPQQIFIICILTILPLTASLGASFTLASSIINDGVKVYILEALGAFCAGILSLILPLYFNSAQTGFLLSWLILISMYAILHKEKTRLVKFSFLLLLSLNILILASGQIRNFQESTTSLRFRPQELIAAQDSIYGNIAITKSENTYSLYDNGKLYFTTEDTEGLEELANMALLSHPDPRKILIIGSGISGIAGQILKFPIESIDYIELDPLLIKMVMQYIPQAQDYRLTDKKLSIYNLDAISFIKSTQNRYDLIILNLGDPLSLQLNRFYTVDFFRRINKILNPSSGIFYFTLSSKEDILGASMLKYNSSIYKSAKEVFRNIEVIPGERMAIACSRNQTQILNTTTLKERLSEWKISNQYFSSYHIDAKLARQKYVTERITKNLNTIAANYDYSPKGFYYYLGLWGKTGWLNFAKIWDITSAINFKFLLIAVLIVIVLTRKKIIKTTIFTTGLTGITLEILIGLIFQINFGFLYYQLGIIIGLFMLGAALGGLCGKINKFLPIKRLILLESALCAVCALTPFILKEWLILYFVITIVLGFIVGHEFSIFCFYESASLVYSLDLAGASVGSLIGVLILIPVMGIYETAFLLSALKLSGAFLLRRV